MNIGFSQKFRLHETSTNIDSTKNQIDHRLDDQCYHENYCLLISLADNFKTKIYIEIERMNCNK
mgnify:CR=1 FL=1